MDDKYPPAEENDTSIKETKKLKSDSFVGVSVLASLSEKNIKNIGFNMQISELVKTLCMSAKQNNIDGVVCSAKEVSEIKRNFGEDFIQLLRELGSAEK